MSHKNASDAHQLCIAASLRMQKRLNDMTKRLAERDRQVLYIPPEEKKEPDDDI